MELKDRQTPWSTEGKRGVKSSRWDGASGQKDGHGKHAELGKMSTVYVCSNVLHTDRGTKCTAPALIIATTGEPDSSRSSS